MMQSSGHYEPARLVVQLIWIALCASILVYCEYAFDGKPNSDAEDVLLIGMAILSFPASIVAGMIAVGIAFAYEKVVGQSMPTTRVEMLLMWALFMGAGYVQWFKVFPYLKAKYITRRSSSFRAEC